MWDAIWSVVGSMIFILGVVGFLSIIGGLLFIAIFLLRMMDSCRQAMIKISSWLGWFAGF